MPVSTRSRSSRRSDSPSWPPSRCDAPHAEGYGVINRGSVARPCLRLQHCGMRRTPAPWRWGKLAWLLAPALMVCCSSSPPTNGGACSTPGDVAVQNSCTACVCESSGHWSCPNDRLANCQQCPTSIQGGTACSTESLTCTRFEFCASSCLCAQGQWDCLPVSCDEPGCPDQPSNGSACSGAAACHYYWPVACIEANCNCVSGHWSCTVDDAGCVDAG